MKYKVGDKIRITKNISSRHFNIGEVVIIEKVWQDEGYIAIDKENKKWFIVDEKCELVKEEDNE